MKQFHRRIFVRLAGMFCVVATLAGTFVACGASAGPPTLTWYVNPDNGGAAKRAQQCVEASNGAYDVRIETLPSNATQQREQLVRRFEELLARPDLHEAHDLVGRAPLRGAGVLPRHLPRMGLHAARAAARRGPRSRAADRRERDGQEQDADRGRGAALPAAAADAGGGRAPLRAGGRHRARRCVPRASHR